MCCGLQYGVFVYCMCQTLSHHAPCHYPRPWQWRCRAFALVAAGVAYVVAAANLAGRSFADFGLFLPLWLAAYVITLSKGVLVNLAQSGVIWCWADVTDLPDDRVFDVELGGQVVDLNRASSYNEWGINFRLPQSGSVVVRRGTSKPLARHQIGGV